MLEDPEIVVSGVEDEGERNAWEYYVNLVHAMDEFAGDLVRAVEERNEPTVLVFYGDHLPTMNLEAKDLKSRYLYNTNYVIWDNIGLEKKDGNVAAYQVMADVFERLDIHAGTVIINSAAIRKIIWQTWNCCSTISCTAISTFTQKKALR